MNSEQNPKKIGGAEVAVDQKGGRCGLAALLGGALLEIPVLNFWIKQTLLDRLSFICSQMLPTRSPEESLTQSNEMRFRPDGRPFMQRRSRFPRIRRHIDKEIAILRRTPGLPQELQLISAQFFLKLEIPDGGIDYGVKGFEVKAHKRRLGCTNHKKWSVRGNGACE
jgi:hypothetical protein